MNKYAIWNKEDPIITPIGEVFSASQWIEKHPVASIPSIKIVCGGGEINGAFFATLGQMVDLYSARGCDFTMCESDQDKLDVIEEFD